MTTFLRFVFCIMWMTISYAAHANEALVQSEQELTLAYDNAVIIVTEQKPILLPDLQKEQEKWRKFRDEECVRANANLPKRYDRKAATEYCLTNMNRKRINVLRGKRANGKDW